MNREYKIRKELVDPLLEEAGWTILPRGSTIPKQGNYAIEEFPTVSGPMDYALFIDSILVGDVESKSFENSSQSILEQAKRYAESYSDGKFNFGVYHIPFIYATNGTIIWFQDLRSKKFLPRRITKFHTPSALNELLDRDIERSLKWLQDNKINFNYLRDFQQTAIEAIESAIQSNKRQILLVMATGTGKTVVTAEVIYRLLKSRLGKRILFLVDRRVLAAQALSRFSSYQPEPAISLSQLYEIYHQEFKNDNIKDKKFNPNKFDYNKIMEPNINDSFVYISTIQRMHMKIFGKNESPITQQDSFDDISEFDSENIDEYKKPPPIHAFDFIIADESHRGYNANDESKWGKVLDHFDCVKIGLTATPALVTTSYFGEPVYCYSVEEAIRDKNLVNWNLVCINSNIRMHGLFLDANEKIKIIDSITGKTKFEQLPSTKEFSTNQLERLVTVPDTNKKIIEEYAKYAREFEKVYGRFPKTIVFATNDLPHVSHADTLVEFIQNEFSDKGRDFVKKITGKVDRPLQRIREFRNRPIEPAIAVTVDLLSTGVDIPTCEAIVFVRPIKSRILFEQMLGRGTRLAPSINKKHFTVLDAVGVVDYFKNVLSFPNPKIRGATKGYNDIIIGLKNNHDYDNNIELLTHKLQIASKNISTNNQNKLKTLIEDGDIDKFLNQLPYLLESDFDNTIHILELFPKYLKIDFILAYDILDNVTSTSLPIVVAGTGYKPDDYIQLFKNFITTQPDKIEALQILLNRPQDLNVDLLKDLRKKLAMTSGQFTVQNLRKAYDNELIDIISMIKAAINDLQPQETVLRVRKAMDVIMGKYNFSEDEKQWLYWIENHLVANLLIEKKHFSMIPFSTKGGWRKADQIFDGKLESIMMELNEVMVS